MRKKSVMSKISDPISIYISLLIDCLVEKRNYSMFSLIVIASSCRVTEKNLLLFQNMCICLAHFLSVECYQCSGTHFYIFIWCFFFFFFFSKSARLIKTALETLFLSKIYFLHF